MGIVALLLRFWRSVACCPGDWRVRVRRQGLGWREYCAKSERSGRVSYWVAGLGNRLSEAGVGVGRCT